jgi:hypothetical protein
LVLDQKVESHHQNVIVEFRILEWVLLHNFAVDLGLEIFVVLLASGVALEVFAT